jgi:hypothetical protein
MSTTVLSKIGIAPSRYADIMWKASTRTLLPSINPN